MGWVASARLLEAIHDEDVFIDTVSELAGRLGARSFFGGLGTEDGLSGMSVDSGWLTSDHVALYNDRFIEHDPCVGAMLGNWRPQEVIDLERIITPQVFEHSRLYQDFIRPLGDDTFRALGVPFELGGAKGAVTFQRGRSQQSFSDDERRLLGIFAEDLAHLFSARMRVVALGQKERVSREMADAIDRPMLIVRRDGRLIRANEAAEILLRTGEPLSVHEGFLRPAHRAAAAGFTAMLEAIVGGSPRSHGMRLGDPDGPIDEALGLPLADGTILLAITHAAPAGRPAMLRALYGLSAAECDVALRLQAGETLGEIAEHRGTSLHTVRQQLRTIALKMDCPRQVDIVSRIGSLPRISLRS